MKTVNEILNLSIDYLKNKQIEDARRLCEELLSCALGLNRVELYMQFDRPIIDEELNKYREYLKRVSKNEPFQYVLGEVDFYSSKIKVDSRALIPRQETEILVDIISKQNPKGILWDLCTGTGCIGIALKKKHPELSVTCTDLSKESLDLASENAKLNKVDVELLQGDLFEPLKGKKADWILCNPPYISKKEYEALDPSVKCFEPSLALIGGERGTEYYERIQKEILDYLNPNGKVYFELGSTQAKALKNLFSSGKLLHDWAGLPRFFTLEKKTTQDL